MHFRRSIIIAELCMQQKSQDVEKKILRFLKRHLTEKFQNSVPEGFIATPRRVVFKFRQIWPTGNR